MVHLLVLTRRDPRRKRLDALAFAGSDQPAQVYRCPALAGFVSQDPQERLEPTLEFALPSSSRLVAHGRSLAGVGPRPSEEVAK